MIKEGILIMWLHLVFVLPLNFSKNLLEHKLGFEFKSETLRRCTKCRNFNAKHRRRTSLKQIIYQHGMHLFAAIL